TANRRRSPFGIVMRSAMPLAIVLLVLVAIVPLVVGLVRANELFVVRVRGDAVALVRGRVPQRLLDDICDVLRAQPTSAATIRVVVESQHPAVYVAGDLSPEQRQRLRNVLSMWPVAKIRAGSRRRRS